MRQLSHIVANQSTIVRWTTGVDTANGLVYTEYLESIYGFSTSGTMSFTGGNATIYASPLGTTLQTKIDIPNYDPGAFNQIIAVGLPSTAENNARAITLLETRSGIHQPTLAAISPNENQIIGLSWDGSNVTGFLKSTGTAIGLRVDAADVLTAGSDFNLYVGNCTSTTPPNLLVLRNKSNSGDPSGVTAACTTAPPRTRSAVTRTVVGVTA